MKWQKDNPLPRELAPGVYWLGQCEPFKFQGQTVHSYASAFLVIGETWSALVEQGSPADIPVIQSQLDTLLTPGVPPLKYLFNTHSERPHQGGVGRFLERYPETVAVGNVTDLHLVFPQFADRLRPLEPGDRLDLGGRELVVVEAAIRDMPYTRWAFETKHRVLFAADGFAFTHLHGEGHCGSLGEETLDTLQVDEMTAMFAYSALHWTQLVDIEPYIEHLDALMAELNVAVVAPTHGLPFTDLATVMPEVREGFRLGSVRESQNIQDSNR